MTTVSADPAIRIRPGTTPADRAGAQLRGALAGLLLLLCAVLIVDNHVMALQGGSLADIGVAGAVLDDPVRSLVPMSSVGPGAAGADARSTGGSVHELRRCFVQARRSGQDPAGCRTGRHRTVVAGG